MLINELPVKSPKKRRLKKMRGLFRRVRLACRADNDYPARAAGDWCNLAHLHLDWRGHGDFSRRARAFFLREYARRFLETAETFARNHREFQLWLLIHPYDSGADSLYIHTPNPHSGFPVLLDEYKWACPAEHLFTEFLPGCQVLEGRSGDGLSLAYFVRGIGVPLINQCQPE